MVNELDKDQIFDSSIVEEDELLSIGTIGVPFSSSLVISNIDAVTKTITLSTGDTSDPRMQEGDIVVITSGVAAGSYTIDSIPSENEIIVNEIIVATTSGDLDVYYRSGAEITGYDPTDSTIFGPSINTVKKALDFITSGGVFGSGFESFFSNGADSTTSNGWVTVVQEITSLKTAGTYVVLHTAQLSQDDDDKVVGYRVQWRENATGSWKTLVRLNQEQEHEDDFSLETGFNLINIGNSTVEVRLQFGKTTDGGTAKIKKKGFSIWRTD